MRIRERDELGPLELLEFYENAIREDPENAENFLGRGRLVYWNARTSNLSVFSDESEERQKLSLLIRTAISDFDRAIALDPSLCLAYYKRAQAKNDAGDVREAIDDYTRAINADPNFAQSYLNLAWILATTLSDELRNGDQAVKLALQGCEKYGWENRCASHSTLAAAYAEAGDFDAACDWQAKVIADAHSGSERTIEEERFEEYQNKIPYRET